ncbi:uncharacterized protein N0V89_007390 [Didymosphaeria variabile]|uniref:Uncharacterized protein n=1 Tax=Didymosphaeria variabile TaxID=1932322 RepID=A0A9W9C9F1_9PLEO|nr:uncharacterized protein N0V89_007390 [Didymosphaeria variabile]KAJ4352044.1 hypothetical protein N0V89_007390 [Didymosphaeria variabile]
MEVLIDSAHGHNSLEALFILLCIFYATVVRRTRLSVALSNLRAETDNFEGGIFLEPPEGEPGHGHGIKRSRSSDKAGVESQTVPKQGNSRDRTRPCSQETVQQDDASELRGEAATTAESDLAGLTDIHNPAEEKEDEELVLDDDDEDVDLDGVGDGEGKPKEPTAKMKKKMDVMAKIVQKEAGLVILTVEQNHLIPTSFNVTWDQDKTKLLCSYNWQGTNDGTNTIFVPGGPPKFVPNRALPCVLEADSGFQAADYNYVRKPWEPFAPLFTALGVMNPGYQFFDIDVLADRNNLRILLEFCQGKANGPLRLDVHMVYNTLVLVRKGEKFWKRQISGVGNNFEKNFTRPGDDMEDATSHYRAIRYPMGPLEVVVRFEADAYFEEAASDDLDPTEADAVTGALLAERPRYDFRPPVRFFQKGHIVPTAQVAELKTVTHKDEGTSAVSCQDQLWFGRTTHLLTGVYKMEDGKGKILRIKYENAKERVDRWEEKNQDALRKLVDLLSRIRTALKQQEGPVRAGLLVRESRDGPLILRTMLRKSHIIGREFFSTHWERKPASAPRGHNMRGRWSADRSHQGRLHPGLRGYHTPSGGAPGNEHHSQASYGANGHQQHPAHEVHYNWQQQESFGPNGYRRHQGYGGQNTQQQPGGYGGYSFQQQNVYEGRYDQQQPGRGRGGWSGGQRSGTSRGYNDGRGRSRGRSGSNYGDPTYGRLPRGF